MDTAAGRWRPNNFEMDFGGPTPLRIALEKSLNLVTLRVAQTVGMEAVAQTAIAFHEVETCRACCPPRWARWTRRCCARPAPMPRWRRAGRR